MTIFSNDDSQWPEYPEFIFRIQIRDDVSVPITRELLVRKLFLKLAEFFAMVSNFHGQP